MRNWQIVWKELVPFHDEKETMCECTSHNESLASSWFCCHVCPGVWILVSLCLNVCNVSHAHRMCVSLCVLLLDDQRLKKSEWRESNNNQTTDGVCAVCCVCVVGETGATEVTDRLKTDADALPRDEKRYNSQLPGIEWCFDDDNVTPSLLSSSFPMIRMESGLRLWKMIPSLLCSTNESLGVDFSSSQSSSCVIYNSFLWNFLFLLLFFHRKSKTAVSFFQESDQCSSDALHWCSEQTSWFWVQGLMMKPLAEAKILVNREHVNVVRGLEW